MAQPILSKRKTEAFANGCFLIALGILFYTGAWWPGILLAIWVLLAVRQYFSGRSYDLFISSIILLGLFTVTYFKYDWTLLMPVLFVVGGIYIIFREYFFSENTNYEDKSQELRDDTDEDTKTR